MLPRFARAQFARLTAFGATALVAGAGIALLGAGSAQADEIGSITFAPATGSNFTLININTSAPCDQGTNLVVKATGNGFPAAGYTVVSNSATSIYTTNDQGGYVIPLSGHFQSFADAQNPPATLSGAYVLTLQCRNAVSGLFGTMTGTITFTSATSYTASGVPTTTPPVTSPPVTSPPVTSPPVTSPPVTSPPVTSPPVTSPPVTSPPATSTPTPTPSSTATSAPALTVRNANGTVYAQGATIPRGTQIIATMTGGYVIGETITVVLNSTPITLTPTTADLVGGFSYTTTIPADLEIGAHSLVFTGAARTTTYEFVVSAGSSAATLSNTGSNDAIFLGVGILLVAAGSTAVVIAKKRGLLDNLLVKH